MPHPAHYRGLRHGRQAVTCLFSEPRLAPAEVSSCPPAATAPSGLEPRACVLGLGNALAGEHLAGLLAVEALAQELDRGAGRAAFSVGLLAQGLCHLPVVLAGMEAVVFVLGLPEPPGGACVRSWPLDPARAGDWEAPGLPALRGALARVSLVQELPREMCVVVVEAAEFEGEGLALGFKRAMRRAVALVVDFLAERGACEAEGRQIPRLYAVPWLGVSF